MKKVIFFIVSLLFLIPRSSPSQNLHIYEDLRMGKHNVGFKVIHKADSSRTYPLIPAGRGAKRSLQISVWYPADYEDDAPQMTFGDYIDLIASETNPADTSRAGKELAINAYAGHYGSFGTNLFKLKRLLLNRVYADKNLPEKKGQFPLIFFVQGRSDSPARNFVMCEYLASNGFVVVSIPAIGVNKRELDFNEQNLKYQIQDQEYLYDYVTGNFKNIDKEKILYIGYSYGSMTSLFMAAIKKNIKALVSLDGSIGFSDRYELIKDYPGFDSSKFTIPLLHLNSIGNPRNDLSLIQELKSDEKFILSFKDFDHVDFTSFGLLSVYENIMRSRRTEPFRMEQLYMYDYILDFLNMILNPGEKSALKFLTFHKTEDFPKELIKFREL